MFFSALLNPEKIPAINFLNFVTTTKIFIFRFQNNEDPQTVLIQTMVKNTYLDSTELNEIGLNLSAYHWRSMQIVKSIAKSFEPEITKIVLDDEIIIAMKAIVRFEKGELAASK
jgi:hypothetical protein